MRAHLVDGTYKLFRHYYAVPPHRNDEGLEVGATRGVVGSILYMLEEGATHVGVATDHVIESFRNDLYPGYKTGEGIDPDLRAQFEPLEETLVAAGVHVWPMVEHEADDALAAAAVMAAADERINQVIICTPDKDLAQCVDGERIVQLDRRKRKVFDEKGVIEKFGVPPASIPDYLALMGDSADGFPGLPGFGAKSSSLLLARYVHLEDIPSDAADWKVKVRGAERLAATLREGREEALLYRHLATLVRDVSDIGNVDDLLWSGPRPGFRAACECLDAPELADRAERLAASR